MAQIVEKATVPSVLGFQLAVMGMLHYGDSGSVQGVKGMIDSGAGDQQRSDRIRERPEHVSGIE